MTEKKYADGWVWVIINDQPQDGHYLGLHDKMRDIDVIPAFVSKEAAGDCYLNLPRERGKKYEVQAIHLDELTADAEKSGFIVAFVDGEGRIIEQPGFDA